MARQRVHEYKSTQRYDFDIRPGETDLEYYRRLAKTADQRLVRLEKLKNEPGFESVDKFAYARAMRDIEVYGGGKRFNTKPPEAPSLFNEKIADMLRFLQSPTSTKGGIIEVYQKRADTLNEKYKASGLNVTWQDIANLHDSGLLTAAKMAMGSDTTWIAIGQVENNAKKIKEVLKEGQKNEKTGKEIQIRRKDGKLTAKAKAMLKEAGVLTGAPSDKGVLHFLDDEQLMQQLLE